MWLCKSTLLHLLFLLSLLSCNDQRVKHSDALKEEIDNRELKIVTDGEIQEAALNKGREIAELAQNILITTLTNAIERSGSVDSSLSYCNLNINPIIDSISKNSDAVIRRVSNKVRNPSDKADSLESIILDAYLYNIERELTIEDNVQKEGDYLLYTKPIFLQSEICLKCHGKEIDTKTIQKLSELYPRDEATGYELNDFRGMWSIRIPKKQLVLDL